MEFSLDEKYVVRTTRSTISRVVYSYPQGGYYYFSSVSLLYKSDVDTGYPSECVYPARGGVYTFSCNSVGHEVYLHKNLDLPALLCPATSKLSSAVIAGLVSWAIKTHKNPLKHHMSRAETHVAPRAHLHKKYQALIDYNLIAAQIRVEPGCSYLKYKDWEDWV